MANAVAHQPVGSSAGVGTAAPAQAGGTAEGEMDALLLGRTRELAAGSPSERNWRGIFIALLVIIAVLGLIVFSIILVSPPEEGPRTKGRKPTLDDIFVKMPPAAHFNGTWINDNEFVYKDEYGAVVLYSAANGTTLTLITNTTFRQQRADDFLISADLQYVLLIQKTKALHFIYELSTGRTHPLTPNELSTVAVPLQSALWSPTGNSIMFIHQNDIYYKPKADRDLICRITQTGVEGVVYNGVPDYLYGGEIVGGGATVWFSPDSTHLLYVTYNDSLIGQYRYTWYSTAQAQVRSFRYPMMGTRNPHVSVWLVNLTVPKYLFPKEVVPMTANVERDSYLTYAGFNSDGSFALVWLNRPQNMSTVVLCRYKNDGSINCSDFHVEREHAGWSEPILHPVFNSNGSQVLLRLPVEDGTNGYYMHICLVQNNGQVVPLTHGAFEIAQILGWDEERNLIYAIATLENRPDVRHLFELEPLELEWNCLTCSAPVTNHSNGTAQNTNSSTAYCDYNRIVFSPLFRFYIQECLGSHVPSVILMETSSNSRLAVLDDGGTLRNVVEQLATPTIKDIQVEIVADYKAQVRLYYPQVLREYEDVLFPLVLLVDGSPGSQTVNAQWTSDWLWYLTNTRGYVVATIDGRGSGWKGVRMRSTLLTEGIGSVDVIDQLSVLTYLRDTFKFIDRERICVVGRGYGGYLAAMMLLQDVNHVINCTVSIAPITKWRYQSTYFTEKFFGVVPSMIRDTVVVGVPEENVHVADVELRLANFDQRNFLLIYGTADRQVVPQHSMHLTKMLIDNEILFKQVVYPDEDHVFSTKSLLHMYKQIDQFFNDSFGPNPDDWIDDSVTFFIK